MQQCMVTPDLSICSSLQGKCTSLMLALEFVTLFLFHIEVYDITLQNGAVQIYGMCPSWKMSLDNVHL